MDRLNEVAQCHASNARITLMTTVLGLIGRAWLGAQAREMRSRTDRPRRGRSSGGVDPIGGNGAAGSQFPTTSTESDRSSAERSGARVAERNIRTGGEPCNRPMAVVRPTQPATRRVPRCQDTDMHVLTRRALLAQIACLGCQSLTESPGSPGRTAAPWRFAIGLNGFGSSETHHATTYVYEEILEFARENGFEGIELWRNWRDGYPDPDDDNAIRESRRKIESYGLQVFSIQAGVRGVNPVSDDTAERAEYTARLNRQVDLAVKFGCDAMGLWSAGREPQGLSEDDLIERFADVVRPVVHHAVESGIVLAIEGEPPLLINSVSRYHKLFEAVGMAEFKAIFDPSHFDVLNGSQGRPEDLLLDLGVDRIGYVQFCDGDSTLRPFPSGGAGTSRHLPCGDGVYDIPKLCSILHEGGFRGWFQMDSWGTEDAYHTSKSCLDSVSDYLRGINAAT